MQDKFGIIIDYSPKKEFSFLKADSVEEYDKAALDKLGYTGDPNRTPVYKDIKLQALANNAKDLKEQFFSTPEGLANFAKTNNIDIKNMGVDKTTGKLSTTVTETLPNGTTVTIKYPSPNRFHQQGYKKVYPVVIIAEIVDLKGETLGYRVVAARTGKKSQVTKERMIESCHNMIIDALIDPNTDLSQVRDVFKPIQNAKFSPNREMLLKILSKKVNGNPDLFTKCRTIIEKYVLSFGDSSSYISSYSTEKPLPIILLIPKTNVTITKANKLPDETHLNLKGAAEVLMKYANESKVATSENLFKDEFTEEQKLKGKKSLDFKTKFTPEQEEVLKDAKKAGVSDEFFKVLANPTLPVARMKKILELKIMGQPSEYISHIDWTAQQFLYLYETMKAGRDVTPILDKRYKVHSMGLILRGIRLGIDPAKFANPEHKTTQISDDFNAEYAKLWEEDYGVIRGAKVK